MAEGCGPACAGSPAGRSGAGSVARSTRQPKEHPQDAIDRDQEHDDAADLNAVTFLGADEPDPVVELDLYVALHTMGWQACLAYVGRANQRRAAQYGADDWVEAHTRASSFYEERKAEVLDELRRLGEGGPFDGDEVARARRMIALAATHSGTTDEGPLPAAWCDPHRAGLGEAARLVATCHDKWCRRQEVWWTRS